MKSWRSSIHYFRRSLIDAERLSPSDDLVLPALGFGDVNQAGDTFHPLDFGDLRDGRVDPQLAKELLARLAPPGRAALTSTEVGLLPRVDHLRAVDGAYPTHKRRVLVPLMVFAMMDAEGRLSPSDKPPWIPREWLAPSQSTSGAIGDLAIVDEFMGRHPYTEVRSWRDLLDYCVDLLGCVSGDRPQGEPAEGLWALALHDDYLRVDHALLQVNTLPVSGATRNIIKTLEGLAERPSAPPLFSTFVRRNSPPLESYRDRGGVDDLARQHLAQMSGEFPLSPNQRNALHHFIEQDGGSILAVNGPPGTGKTTLLRSVVANLWTGAALEESEPPLILASSNNNQAVTNILESFARIDEGGASQALAGRWLPDVDSYGLYCCSMAQARRRPPFAFRGPDGAGCMQEWETRSFVDIAIAGYLEKASAWSGQELTSVKLASQRIHAEMSKLHRNMKARLRQRQEWSALTQQIAEKFGGRGALELSIQQLAERSAEAEKEQQTYRQRLSELMEGWEQRSLWRRLLSRLPLIGPEVRRQEQQKTARRLLEWDLELEDLGDDSVDTWFRQRMAERSREQAQCDAERSEQERKLAQLDELARSLEHWCQTQDQGRFAGDSLVSRMESVLDCGIRFTLFKLATHYWEARWLLEIDAFLSRKDSDKKSPAKVRRRLRRHAKLTPCFVSTFYMTPATMLAGEYQDGVWCDVPLFEELDLLIVDEAGQASPEVAAASFSLAKRALIVGDTDQIEPVWSVPAAVDRANLIACELMQTDDDYDKFWLDSGLLANCGSVMRVAQRQSGCHQFPTLARGLYLTEHRRCYDDIVEYCNDLVYQGNLKPLRGAPKQPLPRPLVQMGMVEVMGSSIRRGGSRGNPTEAQHLAHWIDQHRDDLVAYARAEARGRLDEISEVDILRNTVGVVTPFALQASLIQQELAKSGIRGLTVGTVHKLQGGERQVVLFSSVYGANDGAGGKFYDRAPNMLNVAVSRAKDAFIVFGHPEVFGVGAPGSPSALLRQRLKSLPLVTAA